MRTCFSFKQITIFYDIPIISKNLTNCFVNFLIRLHIDKILNHDFKYKFWYEVVYFLSHDPL